MEKFLDNDFNRQYIRTSCSIALSGLGAYSCTKALSLAGNINRKITGKAAIQAMANNKVYKDASLTVLKRENISFADLSVTKDAFDLPNEV